MTDNDLKQQIDDANAVSPIVLKILAAKLPEPLEVTGLDAGIPTG